MYFEVGNLREIEVGVHAITLRLYDLDENMVGIESSSKFELISHGGEAPHKPADDPKRGRSDRDRQQSTREEDPCAMDLSKTTVSGACCLPTLSFAPDRRVQDWIELLLASATSSPSSHATGGVC